MEINKIVITGGPCAGKTTAMSWIQNTFHKKGYTVLFVPETATELIGNGVAPWTCGSNFEYQKCQCQLQMAKESIFEQAARTMPGDKILIVCDRGMLDNKIYMTDAEFQQIMEELGTNEVEQRDQYNAVFHLVTAAKGVEEAYTRANNKARVETIEEAVALDDGTLNAWTGHPYLRTIDNSTDFLNKMRNLIDEISLFLGEPGPTKIRKKFLVEIPDLNWLESLPNCRRVEIIQTYLRSKEDEEVRIRQWGADSSYIFYMTRKKKDASGNTIKTERRLSQKEYLSRLMDADFSRRQICKTRYCLTHDTLYYEIDLYPFWENQAMVEVEVNYDDQELRLLGHLKVIREVTGDPRYTNTALAKI